MTLNPETKKNVKQFAILSIAFLLILTLFIELPNLIHSKAIGGGWSSSLGTGGGAVNATSFAVTLSSAAVKQFAVKGNFYVIGVTSYSPHTKVSSVSDTPGDTWHLAIASSKFEDTEIWYANYTGTNFASDTITVTFNASTSANFRAQVVTGINSTSIIQTVKNNGTATTASVGSFTPNNNFACFNSIGIDTGSTTVPTWTLPNFFFFQANIQLAASSLFNLNVQEVNNWAGYGATTVSSPFTPSSSPQWDDVVACFSTNAFTLTSTTTTTTTNGMSAGIVQEKNSSTVTGTTNSLTMYYKPQQYNLLIDEVFQQATTGINLPTDNNGLTWTLLISDAGVSQKIAVYGVNFSVASATETVTQTVASSSTYQFRLFEMTGITSNWASVKYALTDTGSVLSASQPSFTPPKNWLGLTLLIYNIGDASAHTWTTMPFSEYNLGLTTMENRMGSTNSWSLSDYYPEWNLGATTATITPNAATSSNWLEDVLFLPTQTSGIVTNTLTSTTTTTTTNTTKTTTSTTTSTSTSTTTTTTTQVNTTTTTTLTNSTVVSTITGTVIPEPKGSTDLLLILLAIAIFLIMMIIGVIKRNPFPTFLGAMVLLIMNVGLYTNNQIVYSQNIIATPLWVNEMITLLVVFAFVLCIYQMAKRR